MNVEEAVSIANGLLYGASHQYFTDIEVLILTRCLEGHGYQQISDEEMHSYKYVKDVGSKVFKKLTLAVGDDKDKATKKNIWAFLERNKNKFQHTNKASKQAVVDWGNAPESLVFLGRKDEIKTLRNWIYSEKCKLIFIVGMKGVGKTNLSVRLGMGGIGKTSLTRQLVDNIQDEFDYVIWRSLLDAPPLKEILQEWIQVLSDQKEFDLPEKSEQKISKILTYLRKYRCLLILDNLESILCKGEIAKSLDVSDGNDKQLNYQGQYREGYEDYGRLLQVIGEGHHKSCLLVNSREIPKNISYLSVSNTSIQLLQLQGIDPVSGVNLLESHGIDVYPIQKAKKMVEFYGGNPLALILLSNHIKLSFANKLETFFDEERKIFSEIEDLLTWHFNRLSNFEIEVLFWLTINREPASMDALKNDLLSRESKKRLADTLKSLQCRIPVEKSGLRFKLQPVLMEFVTEVIVNKACDAIESADASFLNQYALIKANSKDFTRQAQERSILRPVCENTLNFNAREAAKKKIKKILIECQNSDINTSGYLAGNLINLLVCMDFDLSYWDFSGISVRQAYLQRSILIGTDFSKCKFKDSVFRQAFGGIHSIAFSPHGDLLAAGDSLGTISIFQIKEMKECLIIRGHHNDSTDWITTLSFSADGDRIVSGSLNQTVKVWDTRTGECLHTLLGHKSWVWSVDISPDGRTIASAGDDKQIRLWNADTGKCFKILKNHHAWVWTVKFSPNGEYLASGGYDNKIMIWDASSYECLKVLEGHENSVWSLAFRSDSKYLVSGSLDSTVRIWSICSGTNIRTLIGHTKEVRSVAWCPSHKTVFSGSFDKSVKAWNPETGECTRTFYGHSDSVRAIAVHPEGDILASGSNFQEIKLWDTLKGVCYKNQIGYANWIWSAAWNSSNQIMAGGNLDGSIRLWNLHNQEFSSILKGHTGWIWAVEFSPDRKTIASASDDELIMLWDLQTEKCLKTFKGHTNGGVWTLDFHPNGDLLASGGQDGTLRFWDPRLGSLIRTIKAHDAWIWSIKFSPDGSTIATSSDDGFVKLWNVVSGECAGIFSSKSSKVYAISFHPTGQFLAAGTADECVKILDTGNFECSKILSSSPNSWVAALSFSPNGKLLASGGNGDGRVTVCNFESNEIVSVLKGHAGTVRSIMFSHESSEVATAGTDETIRIWDASSGYCKRKIQNPKPYGGMKIKGVLGLNESEISGLKILGATEY